jgi:hypothetical protein
MNKLITAAAVLALTASTAAASWAQDAGGPPPPPPAMSGNGGGGFAAMREACAADFAKYCANVDRSGRRQCIKDNFSQLSDGCKSAILAARAARQSSGGGDAPASH